MNDPLSPLDTLESMVAIASEADGVPLREAFASQGAALLEEAGELSGPERFGAAVGLVDGLDWDAETGRLSVLITDYVPGQWGHERERRGLLPAVSDVAGQLARLLRTADDSTSEDSGRGILSYLSDVRGLVRIIRVIVLSNGAYGSQSSRIDAIAGIPSEVAVWDAGDLVGLVLHSSLRQHVVAFTHLTGGGIHALGPIGDRRSASFLMVLPGDLIADLYQAHGASILGRNIRAFLQVSNRVNKGIRQTVRENPSAFFAFNNGLSLTATSVERALEGGVPMLKSIAGLEIVNGGQTTASLHHAKYHDGLDLSNVRVQAKLTVLPETGSDDTALQIAQFANSQSPVRMGDLTSNSRFFQSIEQLSRSVDFGTEASARLWYFERTRGQFATEIAAAKALGAEARFKGKFDRSRKFDKSGLAKVELAWLQMPAAVAAGAERSLAVFMNLENGPARGGVPDEKYYRRLVAKAILWDETDRVIGALDLGGYKALDVAYTVALISNRTAGRLDLDQVARNQDAGDPWRRAVSDVAREVHENLQSHAGSRNVSTWAKSVAAWAAVQVIPWRPDEQLTSYQPTVDETRVAVAASQPSLDLAAGDGDLEARDRVDAFGSDGWFQLSSWAKETDRLQGWQRGIAFSIGRALASGKTPTAKQVVQAVKILDEADRLGFEPRRG